MLQITPQHCEEPPYLWAKTLASEVFTLRRMRSSHYRRLRSVEEDRDVRVETLTISQTLYSADITPINSTTYFSASAWEINQHATSKPTDKSTVTIVSQSLLAHQSVRRKQTPSTILAILLATMSKPQNIRSAPMIEEPRYPAGRVMAVIPPCMCVTPPSRGSRLIDFTRPPVQTAAVAWPNSWNAITSI